MEKQQLLAQTMAVLMCTTPDTKVGKLLNFCLATKVVAENSGKTPLEFAQDLLQHPDTITDWLAEVVESDDDYSVDEMLAINELPRRPAQAKAYMVAVLAELETLDMQGL
ncbi:MAG: hypothetical protein AAGG51_28850 [Cyanobacteria bacterium P01_G01_bin.54]